MTDTFAAQLCQEAGTEGIELSARQQEQFYRYYEMLVEKNKVMNLTAITEESEVVTKHFVDSLALVRAARAGGLPGWTMDGNPALRLIDVGTGAGFPGIPLKIAFPQLRLTLLDSLNKRVNFLREVCEELGLTEVLALHGRAEDAGRMEEHREQYDVCVSRAVANLASLSEYCLPFVKVGGCFVSYKSGEIDEELERAKRAVGLLGGKIEDVIRFSLPGSEAGRSLVLIRKVKAIGRKYPRKTGLPAKEPL